MEFPPTDGALAARIAAIDPVAYGRTRNRVDGAVTGLSPYLTHGFITLPDLVAGLRARFPADRLGPLEEQLAWREFFRHVWRHRGTAIVKDLGPPPWPGPYAEEIPGDVRRGATGVPVIDAAVRELLLAGWLHNHARLWLASYLVHVRKVRWRAGADWMLGHLLDGDLASNHLSWQWVAGTFATKPYVFNAENVARFAPALASAGTVIDADYPSLDARARTLPDAGPEPGTHEGIDEPPLLPHPPGIAHSAVPPLFRPGETVALVHPWCLRAPPAADRALAVFHAPFHERYRWSGARFAFVTARMRELAGEPWFGDVRALVRMNRGARFVTHATRETGYAKLGEEPNVTALPEGRFQPDPDEPCGSFSAFRRRAGI